MLQFITKKTALISMLSLLGIVLVFHFLVLTQQIPYDKVWAGKLNSVEEMKAFETVSILINVLIMTVLFLKYRLIQHKKTNKIIDTLIWIFVGIFTLNTIGNLFSKSTIELIFGTLFTLVSAILCFIIVKKDTRIAS